MNIGSNDIDTDGGNYDTAIATKPMVTASTTWDGQQDRHIQ